MQNRKYTTHTHTARPHLKIFFSLLSLSLSASFYFSLSLLFDFLCHFVGAAPPCINQRRLERQCPSTDDTKHNNFCCCCVRRHCRQHRQSEHLLSPHPLPPSQLSWCPQQSKFSLGSAFAPSLSHSPPPPLLVHLALCFAYCRFIKSSWRNAPNLWPNYTLFLSLFGQLEDMQWQCSLLLFLLLLLVRLPFSCSFL